MPKSLLGGDPHTPEEQQKWLHEKALTQEATEIAVIIRKALFEAYKSGEIPFKSFCMMVKSAVSVDYVRGFDRQKMLGAAVEAALKSTPPKRSQQSRRCGYAWKDEMCFRLVEIVAKNEGLLKAREVENGQSASQRVADILRNRGMPTTPNAVYKAWSDRPKDDTP